MTYFSLKHRRQLSIVMVVALVPLLVSSATSPSKSGDNHGFSSGKQQQRHKSNQTVQSRVLVAPKSVAGEVGESQRIGRGGGGSIKPASFYEPTRIIETRELKSDKPQKMTDASDLFFEEVDDYPEEEIRKLLRKTPSEIKELYNSHNTPLDPGANLTFRNAHDYLEPSEFNAHREESVCHSVTRLIRPKKMIRENVQVYIPQLVDEDFVQEVEVEICKDPNGGCRYLQDNLPLGMESKCVQKYTYKKLMYYETSLKSMRSDYFRYPSCCSCHVKQSDYDLRSLASSTTTTTSPLEASTQDASTQEVSTQDTSTESTDLSVRKLEERRDTIPNIQERQPKAVRSSSAVEGESSTTRRASNRPPKPIELNENVRTPKQKTPFHTVVVAEDKVYKSTSE